MKNIYIVLTLLMSSLALAKETFNCPACKKECTTLNKLKDDRSKPSRNYAVWNRSICANFSAFYYICETDFYAYESKLKYWGLMLDNKDKFPIKLHKSIYNAPIAKNSKHRVVYSQELYKDRKEEQLFFWFDHDDAYITKIKKYAKDNDLKVELDMKRDKNESHISITKKVMLPNSESKEK